MESAMNKVAILFFSKYRTICYYDEKNNALYVDYDRIYKYEHIQPQLWLSVLSGGSDYLQKILASMNYSVVTKIPKGLTPYVMPTSGVIMYDVSSSNVDCVGYDEDTETLYVRYNSNGMPVYAYENVPISYWNALIDADSKGSWLHWFIKINDGEFPYKKVSGYGLDYSGLKTRNPGIPHPEGYMTGFDGEGGKVQE